MLGKTIFQKEVFELKKILVTFGCSWTFGVGANYVKGMSESEYTENAWNDIISSNLSFRGLISKNLEFKNINFAIPGSSNQRQFRLAKKFFFSDFFNNLKNHNEILVLWGITSTARNELYSIEDSNYRNFFYTERSNPPAWPFPKNFLMYSYDHNNSVHNLIQEIKMFNLLFDRHDIKCIWFDTFNHHDYKKNKNSLTPHEEKSYNILKGVDWPSYDDYINGNCNEIDQTILNEITMDMGNNGNYISTDNYLKNFLFFNKNPRDLLSLMLENNGCNLVDSAYHYSNWAVDNQKIKAGVELNLLNPYSYHPTSQGHQEIFNILKPKITELFASK